MEFKVFGADGPRDDLADDLKALFALDASAWETLAQWFLTTDSFNLEKALSSPVVAASSVLPDQFGQCAGAIKYLLQSWHASQLQLPDLQRDLLIMGFSVQEINRLSALLERLSPLKRRVHMDLMRFLHENAVLPTLEDLDVVCDIRPVFEEHAYLDPYKRAVSHTKLLGFSHMVLIELVAEDFEREKHKLSFQMTEQTLTDFQAALQRAREQLDILKANINALPIEQS